MSDRPNTGGVYHGPNPHWGLDLGQPRGVVWDFRSLSGTGVGSVLQDMS